MATAVEGSLVLQEQVEIGIFSKILVTGPAQSALGFTHQNGSTGKLVHPPWHLAARGDTLLTGNQSGYFIQFASPVRGNYYYSVTYSVAPNLCLRCRGTEVENDYRFDSQNNPRLIEGYNLLYQSCLKILLTEIRSNPYAQWYGTQLSQAIGSKALSGASQALQQTVRTALSNLQNLQSAQAKYQRLTARERLMAVDVVEVTQSPVDPTVFLVEVAVRSYSNDPVNITIVYTAPGTFALPGTNSLSLGNFG
jgi:phage baseplate assembly protein W